MEHMVKNAKENAGKDHVAMAKPYHSTISPKKFAPETYSNIPPTGKKKCVSLYFFFESLILKVLTLGKRACPSKALQSRWQ